MHQETSTPGRIGMMLKAMGFALDIRRPCLGDALPETMDEHAGAVVFGGPMSANDPEPWIAREIDWIGVPLKEQKPFLGVCLGAQMLAKHLGGTVGGHAEERVEIGYYPIYPVNGGDGISDWPQEVYQWHRESFTLPREAKLFARGEHFENQAFRYGACCLWHSVSSGGNAPDHAPLGCYRGAPVFAAARATGAGSSGREPDS